MSLPEELVPATGASIALIFIYSEALQQYILALFSFQIIFSIIPHLSQSCFLHSDTS